MIQSILKHGKSLQQFQTPGNATVFEDAKQYPQFFKNNLIDNSRIIKVFKNDPQANIRVFYYQYLKLCFQLDCDNVEQYISKIQDLITNPQFHFLFPQQQQLQIFNDKQFKRLFIEFFDILNEGSLSVDQALAKFPIADTVMVFFFRTLLIFGGKTQNFDDFIDKTQVFQFLISYFGVQVNVHQHCLKFVETDIFVYQQQKNTVFMVYIDYDSKDSQDAFGDNTQMQKISSRSINDSSSNSEALQPKKNHKRKKTQQNNIKAQQLRKESYIGDFIDFTQGKKSIPDVKELKKQQQKYFKAANQVISQASTRQNEDNLKSDSKTQYSKSNNTQPLVLNQKFPNNYYETNIKNQKNYTKQNFSLPSIVENKFQAKATLSSLYKDSTAMGNKSSNIQSTNNQNTFPYQDSKLDKFIGDMHYSYVNSPNKNENYMNFNKIMSSTAQSCLPDLNNKAYLNNQFGYSYGDKIASPIEGCDINANNYNYNLSNQYNPTSNGINSPKDESYKLKVNNQTFTKYQNGQNNIFKAQNQFMNKNLEISSAVNSTQNNNNPLNSLKQKQYSYSNNQSNYDYGSTKAYMRGINITKEFTNSIILKSISEPHRSIVQNMKTRARAARDSIQRKF